jgi:hypothetical protein
VPEHIFAGSIRTILPVCSETFTALFNALFTAFDLVFSIKFHENLLLNILGPWMALDLCYQGLTLGYEIAEGRQ